MFTGIIEGIGTVRKIVRRRTSHRLTVRSPFSLARVKLGESIAVNGVCLTVVARRQRSFDVDVALESLRVTTLGELGQGSPVNLERALRLHDRLGGHLVLGHVDAFATLTKIKKYSKGPRSPTEGPSRLWRSKGPRSPTAGPSRLRRSKGPRSLIEGQEWQITFPPRLKKYILTKGSIALDGVSLTVNAIKGSHFSIYLIPYTLKCTTLKGKKPKDRLNIEVDILGKYVERWRAKSG